MTNRFSDDDEELLSSSSSKTGVLQRAALALLREHKRKREIPTNGRFIFYELEQRGLIPKHYTGINPKTGKPWVRTPADNLTEALTTLRKRGLVPWEWILDETCEMHNWHYGDTVADYLAEAVDRARIDLWQGEPPPMIICESRAVSGVLQRLAYEYLVPLTATGGQSAGHIVNKIVPLLRDDRQVLYIGDYELRGPAEQIEANTKRYIEEHTGREFDEDEWIKIALTEEQVEANPALRRLEISKKDNRYDPPKRYQAIECEALGQSEIVRLIREQLVERLPEPLDEVLEREAEQRERVRDELAELAERLKAEE